jgi:hypothetical protein
MSDALTDMVHGGKEQAKYFDEINKLAEFIGKRALIRPNGLRQEYIRIAMSEVDKDLKSAIENNIGIHENKTR